MDLFAYMQIGDYGELAEKNGIEVPRLRGYRLMSEENIISKEEYETLNDFFYEHLICTVPLFKDSGMVEFSWKTDIKRKIYLITKEGGHLDFNWDIIHGKNRRFLKTQIHNQLKAQRLQFETFNKYVGRKDVLMIHSRIGGNNWTYYEGPTTIANQPWFLEKVDDSFDSTYCDIYAKINLEGGDNNEI